MQDAARTRSARSQRRPRNEAPPPPGPAPDSTRLRDAALAHLARFAATEAGLVRVLDRRIQRWAARTVAAGEAGDQVEARAAEARRCARAVAATLVASGVVDDTVYAESKVRSLTRGGRSRRAIGAHLAAKGVDAETARAALPDDRESDLAAAVLQARRRRIGPFGDPDAPLDLASRNKALASLARAGFSRDVAERALQMDRDAAEQLVLLLKQG